MRVWRNWLDALALEASGEIPMRVRISLPAPFKIGVLGIVPAEVAQFHGRAPV